MIALLALAAAALTPPPLSPCRDLLPAGVNTGTSRSLAARDLVTLREFGQPDPAMIGGASPIAPSPDGRTLALVLRRADPDANRYCQALVILPTDGRTSPRIVAEGGDLVTQSDAVRSYRVPGGFPALITPRWSPDGRSIAWLRRNHGINNVWRARLGGTAAIQVTKLASDVEEFAWSEDGHRLIVRTRAGVGSASNAATSEARRGYLYDGRIWPEFSWAPLPSANLPVATLSVDVDTGADRKATPSETQSIPNDVDAVAETSSEGFVARTRPDTPSPASPSRIVVTDPAGRDVPCRTPQCADRIVALWWLADGRTLLFQRREGWAHGTMAIYRWRPGAGQPRRILESPLWLTGCTPARTTLVCGGEDATHPRRLVAIDARTGALRTLFEPNPDFTRLDLGRVQRLSWRNSLGLPAWGDLVLPPGYRAGQKPPLVVVQYQSYGFLNGGTGNDYPIFLLAARGMAVLSTQRPPPVSTLQPDLPSWDAINAADMKGWADRRSLYSSVMTGIDRAVALGVADPDRLGITGLSDGSATLEWALIHSRRFGAAATSTCCYEQRTMMTYGGTVWADWNRYTLGYPPASRDDPDFWRPQAISRTAGTIDTPLLIQQADREAVFALETFTALREQGKPVELVVFPDEYHYKWQPAHRLATYERAADWFDFWLRNHEDPDPMKADQYRRWENMGAERRRSPPPTRP